MRKKMLWIFFIILLIFSILVVNMIGLTVAQGTHDIAVISVTPSPTLVRLGELVNITVVVENQGTESETFNVTVYHDTTGIETRTSIVLEAGLSKNLTFTWNTTDVEEEIYATDKKGKTYIINATATLTLDEDPDDNMLVSSSTVKIISHYIEVVPQSTVDPNLTPGKNYTVSIYTDYNGSDVWGWEFSLTYNPDILQGIEVTNGDLITTDKDPSATFGPGTFDNELGELKDVYAAFFLYEPGEPIPVTSGPGTLATVTFRVVGTGDSYITLGTETLSPTKLKRPKEGDNIIDDITPDTGHILHGYFRNIETVIHDIAVISVTPFPTSVVAGEEVNVTVVVENQGNVKETFEVEVYYDYDPNFPTHNRIGNQTVSDLAAGANKSLTFVWNTTGVLTGNRVITTVVSKLVDETETEDNRLDSDQTVNITELKEQPLPIDLIIGVVVAVIVVIAVAFYALKRRKKPAPE